MMWNLGPDEFEERLARGREIWERRNQGGPSPRPLTVEDLRQKARLESLIALALKDAEATAGLRLTARVLANDEWNRESSTLDFLALSYEDEEGDEREREDQAAASEDDEEDDPALVVEIAGRSGPWHTDRSDEEILVELADWVQEAVIDEVQGAWPVCPGHPHPADPVLVSGTPVWACTRHSRPTVIAPIGQLPKT